MPILLVRHAHAGRRSAYKGDDRTRPLSKRGAAQAQALVPLLAEYRPQRILSSPYVRCCATVQPTAEALGLPVESIEELAEGRRAGLARHNRRRILAPQAATIEERVMPLTKELGQFVADLSPNRLPEEAVRVARMGFIDCIGTMIAGRNEDCVRIMKQVLSPPTGRPP